MDPIVVVGSGASGVHFAITALRKGRRVTMLDVGHTGREAVMPGETLSGLKRKLPDPALYFLGPRYESLVLPGNQGEYYAFPPAKEHVFRPHPEFQFQGDGFAPLYSFAAGGLAEVWTGGCYPFDDSDLSKFPFGYEELGPYYARVAADIGISGEKDDLAAVFPYHNGLMEPVKLDEHSAVLLDSYRRRRSLLNEKSHCLMGRARVAVLSRDLGSRKRCDYSGRCLWGCPSQAFYTPSVTLAECRTFPGFEYCAGLYVDHFRMDGAGRVRSVVVSARDGQTREIAAGSLVLAAGTLCSARIYLESLYRDGGKTPELRGVMDNRQVLMPFVNLRMLGRPWSRGDLSISPGCHGGPNGFRGEDPRIGDYLENRADPSPGTNSSIRPGNGRLGLPRYPWSARDGEHQPAGSPPRREHDRARYFIEAAPAGDSLPSGER